MWQSIRIDQGVGNVFILLNGIIFPFMKKKYHFEENEQKIRVLLGIGRVFNCLYAMLECSCMNVYSGGCLKMSWQPPLLLFCKDVHTCNMPQSSEGLWRPPPV